MRYEPMAIAALTVMASTMGSMACRAWSMQGNHRQAMQCVRPGMTAAQVRTVLGRPRAVWTGAGPLKAALKREGAPMQRPPSGWRQALVYPTTTNTRLVVLLDARGRTTAVLDYGT